MTLDHFISNYDMPGSVVLLLGKRDVLPEDKNLIEEIAALLTRSSKHLLFRSGNAGGADELFANGVASIDPERMEVITPYIGHRKKYADQYRNFSLDQIDLLTEPEILSYAKKNKTNQGLIERYEKGHRDKHGIKGAYLLRDTLMVVGAKSLCVPRASFGVFYDDLSNPKNGGTGHTMKICDAIGIPYLDQRIWKEWIK